MIATAKSSWEMRLSLACSCSPRRPYPTELTAHLDCITVWDSSIEPVQQATRSPVVEPGYFHRLAIATTPEQQLADWLRAVVGAREWRTPMRQVHGLPFGAATPGTSAESGALAQILWLGRTPLCLLVATDPNGTLGRYVARHGTGLHSVAWTIHDVWGAQTELSRRGVRITGVDLAGRHFFLHPADTAGLLIELTDTEFTEDPRDGVQRPPDPDRFAPVVRFVG